MSVTLTVRDESATGKSTNELSLDFLSQTITVRELIRSRVYEEVQEYNLRSPEYFRGLVQPAEAEQTPNGFCVRKGRQIDWKKQFELACDAFEHDGFVIHVDDKKAE